MGRKTRAGVSRARRKRRRVVVEEEEAEDAEAMKVVEMEGRAAAACRTPPLLSALPLTHRATRLPPRYLPPRQALMAAVVEVEEVIIRRHRSIMTPRSTHQGMKGRSTHFHRLQEVIMAMRTLTTHTAPPHQALRTATQRATHHHRLTVIIHQQAPRMEQPTLTITTDITRTRPHVPPPLTMAMRHTIPTIHITLHHRLMDITITLLLHTRMRRPPPPQAPPTTITAKQTGAQWSSTAAARPPLQAPPPQ